MLLGKFPPSISTAVLVQFQARSLLQGNPFPLNPLGFSNLLDVFDLWDSVSCEDLVDAGPPCFCVGQELPLLGLGATLLTTARSMGTSGFEPLILIPWVVHPGEECEPWCFLPKK